MRLLVPGLAQAGPLMGPAGVRPVGHESLDFEPTARGYRAEIARVPPGGQCAEVELGHGDARDIILEVDWDDGTEDLVSLWELQHSSSFHTNDGRLLSLAAVEDGVVVLRHQSPDAAMMSVRVHRFDLKTEDIAALLANLEVRASADTALYVPRPALVDGRWEMQLGPQARHLPTGGDPWLLLVHGTAGSTEVSFGPLAEPAVWAELRARYGYRILTFEHRTLSEGLLRSAIDLLRNVPANATFDVLSISRAGMFLELLVHGEVDTQHARDTATCCLRAELAGFEHRAFLRAVEAYNALFQHKRPRIRRLVRAGCAIDGIPVLRDGSTRYFGLLFASSRLVFDHDAERLDTRQRRLQALLRSVRLVLTRAARSHGEAIGLPGMDAQRPDAPVLRLLRTAAETSAPRDSELAVICGDFEAWDPVTFAIQRAGAYVHGLPWRGDHDTVVPVESMRGGLPRTDALLHIERGRHAHHFNYLEHTPLRDRILAWLTRPAGAAFETGFEDVDVERYSGVPMRSR